MKSVERNPEEEAKMAQMSFDERMKFYKEKYGTAISEPSKQPQAVSQSKAASQKKLKGQKQNTVTKQAMPAASQKQNKSVGGKATGGGGLKSRSLFSRIKAFFGKK